MTVTAQSRAPDLATMGLGKNGGKFAGARAMVRQAYTEGASSLVATVETPAFRLQFPIQQVPEYAGRYAYEDDREVMDIGRLARDRGYYTLEQFRTVCRWKTPRSGPLVVLNSADSVEASTGVALRETSSERERAEALLSLRGVGWPTASVLLHLAYPERYPILDVRALHALGVRAPSAYSFRFWQAYVSASVRLAEQAGVDGRTFDQALWQWSKEQDASSTASRVGA